MAKDKLISFFVGPIISGLVIGGVILTLINAQNPRIETRIRSSNDNATRLQPLVSRQNVASYSNAIAKAAPSVVTIYIKAVRFEKHPLARDPIFQRLFNTANIPLQEKILGSTGSGVIVDSEGYILTNWHVIKDAKKIAVQLHDGRESTATLIFEDIETDLAIIKIDLDKLKKIEVGDVGNARVGDIVFAIGNPLSIGQSVSQGIISAIGQRGIEHKYGSYIQTDAAVNRGNSGGALIDVYGRLVGIVMSDVTFDNTDRNTPPKGIALAIPADQAIQVYNDGIEFGRVFRGWLGVNIDHISKSIAKNYKLPITSGMFVNGVEANSPAEKAGLRTGDIIVKIDNQPVDSAERIRHMIRQSPPGDQITIETFRNDHIIQLVATIGTKPQTAQ